MSRKQQQRKKQILFLLAIAVFLLACTAFLVIKYVGTEEIISFQENSREDTILYDGKEYRYNDHLSNYLFMGIDTREIEKEDTGRTYAGQADAIFLVSLDRAKMTLQCLVIPRDTITRIESFTPDGDSLGFMDSHINLQYALGDGREKSCELMKEAVSNMLYELPIQGYCSLSMDGIPIAVDTIGGVPLTVPDDSLEKINPEFSEGAEVVLTKETAEQFVRYRDINESQSALVRSDRQKVFLKAFVERAYSIYETDPSVAGELYENVQDYMITNMSNDLFMKLLEASYGSEKNIQTLPGKGLDDGEYDVYNVDNEDLYTLMLQMFYVEV